METSTPQSKEPVLYSFRNRDIRSSDVAFIKEMIKRHHAEGRSSIARRLCEAWGWRQIGGQLKDMACRDLLLRLEGRGFVTLPKPLNKGRGSLTLSLDEQPLPVTPRPIEACELSRIEVTPVVGRAERLAWRILVDRFHYLGAGTVPGEHRLYFARLDGEIVGCIGWSAAALHCPQRDALVGWDFEAKRQRLHLVANNQRLLILPWVKVKGMASRILGLNLRRISRDWLEVYGHPLALVETFVDVTRFAGTVYKASNWMHVGMTRGRGGRQGYTYSNVKGHTPKAVYLYPLHRHFREILIGRDR